MKTYIRILYCNVMFALIFANVKGRQCAENQTDFQSSKKTSEIIEDGYGNSNMYSDSYNFDHDSILTNNMPLEAAPATIDDILSNNDGVYADIHSLINEQALMQDTSEEANSNDADNSEEANNNSNYADNPEISDIIMSTEEFYSIAHNENT